MLYSVTAEMQDEELFENGFELRSCGKYAEAREVLAELLRRDPRHVGALHQIALIQGFEGDFDGSLAALDALATANPQNVDVRYDLAMTQMMLGMYEEACSNLKQILAAHPDHDKASQQVVYC